MKEMIKTYSYQDVSIAFLYILPQSKPKWNKNLSFFCMAVQLGRNIAKRRRDEFMPFPRALV